MSISRRKFLKTKGAVLTLPFLHSFADVLGAPKKKDKPSKKLVIMYVPPSMSRFVTRTIISCGVLIQCAPLAFCSS